MADGPILVTGAAGFIGFHVAQRLLGESLMFRVHDHKDA